MIGRVRQSPRRHSWLVQVRRKVLIHGVHTIVNTA